MRANPASQNAFPGLKALVLGQPDRARPIAAALSKQGYEIVAEQAIASALPHPADPGAVEGLRAHLAEFARLAGPTQGPFAHCVHPGTSRWAERPELPALCQELGLDAVAPPVRVVSLFANKLNLLAEADALGISTLVLSFDPVHSAREVEMFLRTGSYRLPFVLKSVRGGAGFGIFVVRSADDLERRFPLWLEQLRRNFGEAILFPERYVESARRIVVPFARFQSGRTEIFAWSDASLQSRYRKLIDFCPAPSIDAEAERRIRDWTARLIDHCGFVGAGSLEFFVDGPAVYLLDGAARLNLGYQLWERVERTDAVAWQLAALGVGKVPPPERSAGREAGVSLLARIFAEDPLLQLPQPGRVHEVSEQREWRFPRAHAELTLGIEPGSEVPPPQDGMLGLLYVNAPERAQAMTIARGILDELWICGSLQTNERFLSELLAHPFVEEAMFHAGFVEEDFLPEIRPNAALMGAFAAVCASVLEAQPGYQPQAGSRWAVGDQWVKPDAEAARWISGPRLFNRAEGPGGSGVIRTAEGRELRTCVFPVAENRWLVRIGTWFLSVRSIAPRPKTENRHRLLSLVSGRVHSVLFRETSQIPAHEPLVIVESLGTLVPHALPADARVTQWRVSAEEPVRAGQELAIFEKLR